MWGNRLGWTISAILLLIAIISGVLLAETLEPTAPTQLSLDPANLEKLMPPPLPVMPMNQPGDAGEMYRLALAAYANDIPACEKYVRDPQGDPPPPLKLLRDAAEHAGTDIFAADPATIVNYENDHPNLESLNHLGHLAAGTGESLHLKDRSENARVWFNAEMALGSRLINERLDYDEYSSGLDLASDALAGMEELVQKDAATSAELQDTGKSLADFNSKWVLPIYQVISSANAGVIATNAGDVFRFAQLSGERMFRVEATLKLGRYRFDAARFADQAGANRALRRLANDPDPAVKAAVAAAQQLTVEEYRQIH